MKRRRISDADRVRAEREAHICDKVESALALLDSASFGFSEMGVGAGDPHWRALDDAIARLCEIVGRRP